jgi:hypothetical protein
MRNGIVHAAESTEVEERILTAFVQQADTLTAGPATGMPAVAGRNPHARASAHAEH